MKPPRGGHRQARDLRHDSPESAVTQALFKTGEDGLLVAGLKIDDAVRLQAGSREGWREEIGSSDTPEHLSSCARCDAGSEECSRGSVDGAVSPASDFMQRTD